MSEGQAEWGLLNDRQTSSPIQPAKPESLIEMEQELSFGIGQELRVGSERDKTALRHLSIHGHSRQLCNVLNFLLLAGPNSFGVGDIVLLLGVILPPLPLQSRSCGHSSNRPRGSLWLQPRNSNWLLGGRHPLFLWPAPVGRHSLSDALAQQGPYSRR